MICGCPGSGTSLVTKMLRHAGLFVGCDSGPKEARKYHESQCFKKHNEQFLSQTIAFPHAPKSAEQFNAHNQRMSESLEELIDSVDIDELMNDFWGTATERKHQNWGWKDPRNSANALVWTNLFPEMKAIVISRNVRWRDRRINTGSDSGRWFRQESTSKLRSLYKKPIGLSPDMIFQIDVDQLTRDAEVFRKTLNWCGLDEGPANSFEKYLGKIGFES